MKQKLSQISAPALAGVVKKKSIRAAIAEIKNCSYDGALARIFVSSVEVNGFGRRQLMVSGSKGTVNICPLERPITMTYSDASIADKTYEDCKITVPFEDHTAHGRYDEMMQDFYAYVMGTKQNPFTYEHDYLVQKVLSEIVGGVRFYGKRIEKRRRSCF